MSQTEITQHYSNNTNVQVGEHLLQLRDFHSLMAVIAGERGCVMGVGGVSLHIFNIFLPSDNALRSDVVSHRPFKGDLGCPQQKELSELPWGGWERLLESGEEERSSFSIWNSSFVPHHPPSHQTILNWSDGMRCCRSDCFVIINPRVLSANSVDLGFFLKKNFQFYPPPPPHSLRRFSLLTTATEPTGLYSTMAVSLQFLTLGSPCRT